MPDFVGFDPERMGKVAQYRMVVRVVLTVENLHIATTEDLEHDLERTLATTTARMASRVFQMACSEIQGVCHIATFGKWFLRCRS